MFARTRLDLVGWLLMLAPPGMALAGSLFLASGALVLGAAYGVLSYRTGSMRYSAHFHTLAGLASLL